MNSNKGRKVRRQEPARTLRDLDRATTVEKKAAITKKFYPLVLLSDGETWSGLQGCSLVITDDDLIDLIDSDVESVIRETGNKYPNHEVYGEYDLGKLLQELPLETLRKYKVSKSPAPPPVAVREKR